MGVQLKVLLVPYNGVGTKEFFSMKLLLRQGFDMRQHPLPINNEN